MPERRILKIAMAAVTIASAVGLTATAATAAQTTKTATASASPTAGHVAERNTQNLETVLGAYDNCPSGYYCDYAGTDGSDPCFFANVSLSNWSAVGCQNIDESFANRTSGLVRLYYLPDFKGAWVCIDASKYSNNLAGYVFNNGSGDAGYGAPLENDVASSQTGSGNCSNPLPWP